MGTNNSKTCDKHETSNNDLGNLDPRSPTPEVVRTPLHTKNETKHAITKNMDLRNTFDEVKEENFKHNNPILSAVIKNHFQFDPRSPTQEFERTPIVINSKISKIDEGLIKFNSESCGSPNLMNDTNNAIKEKSEIQPDIVPKNLCNELFDSTFNNTIDHSQEPLGSSTASNDTIEKNNSSEHDISRLSKFSECNLSTDSNKKGFLLETNFDYIDDVKSSDTDDIILNNNSVGQAEKAIKGIPHFKILDIDPRSPSVGIDRTPIVVPKEEEVIENDEETSESLIEALKITNVELRQNVKSEGRPSESLMIYEDQTSYNCTPKKSMTLRTFGNRTPLSCMKNKPVTNLDSKSSNTIDPKNTKVQSKIPKRASYIPRLKSLSKHTNVTTSSRSLNNLAKISVGDCENTPPQSHRDKWDKDSSIVL